MAQRIHLIPVDPQAVELLISAILGETEPALAALAGRGLRERQGGSPGEWKLLAADTVILRRMRGAFLAGQPYAHEIPKPSAWDGEESAISAGAEPRTFEGPSLAEVYGQLLGSTLGHLLGLTFPTWSLGDGYSLGLLLAGGLSPSAAPPPLAERAGSASGWPGCPRPRRRSYRVAAPGFEAGFPLLRP